MSNWIHSYQSLRNHPKTRKLSRRVGGIAPAVGHLHCLWWWSMDYARDGDLTKFTPEDVAIAAEWDGDPETFIGYLVECEFLENSDGLRIHDHYEYIGRFIDVREEEAARSREMREAYADGTIERVRARDGDICRYCGVEVSWRDRRGKSGATYDHVDPSGPSTTENLVVCCRSCNSKKRERTLKQAGLKLSQIEPRSEPESDLLDRKIERKKERTRAGAGCGTKPPARSKDKSEPTKIGDTAREVARKLRAGEPLEATP